MSKSLKMAESIILGIGTSAKRKDDIECTPSRDGWTGNAFCILHPLSGESAWRHTGRVRCLLPCTSDYRDWMWHKLGFIQKNAVGLHSKQILTL